MTNWDWHYEGYDPADEPLREALCTVGNGYLATRGAAPECDAGGAHYPGTYAAGVFNRLVTRIEGHDVPNESMVNLPNWLSLTFRVDGGAWFHIDEVEVLDHHLTFDLHRAVLVRRTRFRDAQGRHTRLIQRRFTSMDFKHLCALETTVVAEDWSGVLEVRSALDGTVENLNVERYKDLDSRHLEPVQTHCTPSGTAVLVVRTNQSHIRIAMAARHLVCVDGEPVDAEARTHQDDGWIGRHLSVRLDAGRRATVHKFVTVFTSRDDAISEPAEEAQRWVERLDDFDELLADHSRVWRHLWNRFHVDTEDGHDELLRILRLHLVHVLQTLSPNTVGLDAGVPARGLHGEAYRGHILWDELFVLPLLNLRLPAISRAALLYRYRRLPEARAAAREAGHVGAMFPWQSGSDGREESQHLHLNPVSGRWLEDPTHRQRHVGLAIAYNVWQYFQTTGDQEFLTEHGAELLLDIAHFFSSLATYDPGRDRYVIREVMGPDEFHSAYPDAERFGIDDNAYTNVLAVWVLLRARETIALLPAPACDALLDQLGIGPDELDRWRDITEKMYVPFHDGVISQFEGYGDLEELPWDELAERHDDLQRLDRILEAEGDSVNRYKASKQADVLMLFYLLSADELRSVFAHLGYELDADTIPRTIDYYLERTSHGSTLSAVVHSWVLARAHRDRGVDLFWEALRADVVDIQGGTTPEGIHLAAMAGSIDLLQGCFAGLETRDGRLAFNPYWPERLGSLVFCVVYRDAPLTVRVTGRELEVASDPRAAHPVTISCRGDTVELAPGSTVSFSQDPAARGADHAR